MNDFKLEKFKILYETLNLSHHPFSRMFSYLKWCFKDVNFDNKSVLDIGGGNGIYSFYARFRGAKSALNLEPFAEGSTEFDFDRFQTNYDLEIQIETKSIQDFFTSKKFDIIILHDSNNHLNESIYVNIDRDTNEFFKYKELINKIVSFLENDGKIIVTDCARRNFWGDLGIKNPFAPSIEWNLHQSPQLVERLFEDHKFKSELRWSPFKRLYFFGRILSKFGYIPSYFMQSHFNLVLFGNDQ